MSAPRWLNSREIERRIVIRGDLALETPARLGNGDTDGLVDMPLLLDPVAGVPLLTGASIAGALRSYLRQREVGYWPQDEKQSPLETTLFGYQKGDNGGQSWLIVDDALGVSPPPLPSQARPTQGDQAQRRPRVELRDGVAIDPKTRTADDKKKYDFEALQAGTCFPLRLELLVRDKEREQVVKAVALALQGLERGEIPIGGRKRRGLGQCRVAQWTVIDYDLTDPQRLVAWLDGDESGRQDGTKIAPLLGLPAEPTDDQRESFELKATFALDGSLLIRSAPMRKGEPDFVHLRSRRGDDLKPKPILSGTSLAGALRARALRIARTVATTPDTGDHFVDKMFGPHIDETVEIARRAKPKASRLIAAETEIGEPLHLVQTRVKIDRFTGGAFPTGLFSEEPVFSQAGTEVCISLELHGPSKPQIGLLLLLLKDLWLGDLPLGGESSVGRGRLKGQKATLTYRQGATTEAWTIEANGAGLTISGKVDTLQGYVDDFIKEVAP